MIFKQNRGANCARLDGDGLVARNRTQNITSEQNLITTSLMIFRENDAGVSEHSDVKIAPSTFHRRRVRFDAALSKVQHIDLCRFSYIDSS